jgi:hypothetical protein
MDDEITAEHEFDAGAAPTVADRSPTAVFFGAAAVSLGRFQAALAEAGEKFDGLDGTAQLRLVGELFGILRHHSEDTADLLVHLKVEERRLQAIEDAK